MRNLLALLAVAVLTFALVGWYRDWYKIQSAPTQDGQRRVTVDINSAKISDDLSKGTARLQEALKREREDPSFVGPHQPEKQEPIPR